MARDNALRFTFSTVNNSFSSVTLTAGGSVATAVTPAIAPPNGVVVSFPTITVTGLVANTPYYVVNSSGATFGLSSVLNGPALALSGTTQSGASMVTFNTNAVSTALGGRSGGPAHSEP